MPKRLVYQMDMKKVVYTAIFGDKDDLKEVSRVEGWDYLVFTDNVNLTSDSWEIIIYPSEHNDPARDAKRFKILPHFYLESCEYSLWIDASIIIDRIDLDMLFTTYLKHHDMAIHRHPERNCIYAEADACIRLLKDDPELIKKQMGSYIENGYPKENGLVSAGIIFRRHSKEIAELNTLWWREILQHSRRDQLSFNYVSWMSGIEYLELDGNIRNKDEVGFIIRKHKMPDFVNW